MSFLNNIESNNKLFINKLKLEKDFSFWYLTNFCEKNLYKKNKFFELMKILAIYQISKEVDFDYALIDLKNKKYENILLKILKNKNNYKSFSLIEYLNFVLFELFSFIKGIYFLVCKLFINKKKILFNTNYNLFISFFTYIEKKNFKINNYKSSFWGNLKEVTKINFLHLFIKNNINKNFDDLNSKLKKFSNEFEIHNFLDSYIDIKTILKILFKAIFIKLKYHFIKKDFKLYYKNLDLTQAINFDLHRNFLFFDIVVKLYYFFLFKNFFKKIRFNKNCFYIHENQPWEKSLIYHWKKNQKKKIFGVINSSIRFWDIRFEKSNIFPHKLLVNGYDGYKKLLGLSHNVSDLKVVETLRYENFIKPSLTKSQFNNEVLILLDYSNYSNRILVDILNRSNLIKNFNVTLKNHPLNDFRNSIDFKYKKFNSKEQKKDFDIVICTNRTTAAVDYYLRGKNLSILLEPNFFNFSPLKGNNNCNFFSDHNQLDEILKNNSNNIKNINSKFFMINPDYPKWKEILKNGK